ncbi:hypothetical protein H0H93_016009 [Arthromyces matolae]|nr:hypothetical protein H0H93_016009 [Arthromyces matolae]
MTTLTLGNLITWITPFNNALILTSTVLTIVVLSIYSNANFLLQSGEDNSKTLLLLSIAPTIASLLTNSIATSFVGYRLWYVNNLGYLQTLKPDRAHMKFLKKNLEGRSQRLFQLKHILSILVDTGFVYAVLQLCVIILNVVSNDDIGDALENAFRIFTNIYYSISFVYPALTIALIRGQFSIAGIHESVVHISTIGA